MAGVDWRVDYVKLGCHNNGTVSQMVPKVGFKGKIVNLVLINMSVSSKDDSHKWGFL